MDNFALEILNSGRSENVSLLSEEAMSEALGGMIKCKKGYELGDDGAVSCGCSYSSDKPPVIIVTPPDRPEPPILYS